MLKRTLAFAMLTALQASGIGASERDLAWLPTTVTAEPIGERIRINGLATQVVRLHGAVNVQQLRDAFLAQDAADSLPQAHVEGWDLYARPVAGGMQTLQVRIGAHGEPEAYFAITDLSPGSANLPGPAPLELPAYTTVTSIVESSDRGLRGTQYVAWSTLSIARLRQRVCARAQADGWQVRDCRAETIDMTRDGQSLSASVAGAHAHFGGRLRSVVVVNHVQQGR